jgi:hypothetical protein
MIYKDRLTERSAQNPESLSQIQSAIGAVRRVPGGTLSAVAAALAYVAHARGPTPSASALVYASVAVAGTILYEAWYENSTDDGQRRGLVCERGCLRRLTGSLRRKAIDEIRLHQDLLSRSLHYRSLVSTPV